MGKVSQNASSLKPPGQFKPIFPRMIIVRSSTKFRFSMPIGNPRWLPLQEIDYHWTLHVWENVQIPSFQKLKILLKPNCTCMFIGWSSKNFRFFCSDMKFKMAATAGLSLTLAPMGKMFQNAFSLKPLVAVVMDTYFVTTRITLFI